MADRQHQAYLLLTKEQMERKILLTDTADEPGLIYKITEVCFLHGLNIIKNQEYIRQESEALLEDAKAAQEEASPGETEEDMGGGDDDIGF